MLFAFFDDRRHKIPSVHIAQFLIPGPIFLKNADTLQIDNVMQGGNQRYFTENWSRITGTM